MPLFAEHGLHLRSMNFQNKGKDFLQGDETILAAMRVRNHDMNCLHGFKSIVFKLGSPASSVRRRECGSFLIQQWDITAALIQASRSGP